MIRELVEEYLLYLKAVRVLSGASVSSYAADAKNFLRLLGKDEIEEVTLFDLRSCILSLSKEGKKATSVNRFIAFVRGFFAYCRRNEYIEQNPASLLKNLKAERRLPRFLTGREVDTLCRQPEKKELLWATRDKAILECLYSTGCRVSELSALKFKDFDGDFKKALVLGKGKKERFVFFERAAREALFAYFEDRKKRFGESEEEHIFVNCRGKAITARGVMYIVSRYSGREGTNHPVSPHALRHTFATAMMNSGLDIRIVQELLGHSSISTTQIYTHTGLQKLVEVYNKAHPHGGGRSGGDKKK